MITSGDDYDGVEEDYYYYDDYGDEEDLYDYAEYRFPSTTNTISTTTITITTTTITTTTMDMRKTVMTTLNTGLLHTFPDCHSNQLLTLLSKKSLKRFEM